MKKKFSVKVTVSQVDETGLFHEHTTELKDGYTMTVERDSTGAAVCNVFMDAEPERLLEMAFKALDMLEPTARAMICETYGIATIQNPQAIATNFSPK